VGAPDRRHPADHVHIARHIARDMRGIVAVVAFSSPDTPTGRHPGRPARTAARCGWRAGLPRRRAIPGAKGDAHRSDTHLAWQIIGDQRARPLCADASKSRSGASRGPIWVTPLGISTASMSAN